MGDGGEAETAACHMVVIQIDNVLTGVHQHIIRYPATKPALAHMCISRMLRAARISDTAAATMHKAVTAYTIQDLLCKGANDEQQPEQPD